MNVSLKTLISILVVGFVLGAGAAYYYLPQNMGQITSDPVPASFESLKEGDATLYVCPQDDCANRLIDFIQSAKQSVHVMIYSFTLDDVGDAIIDAKNRGVDVKVLMDNTQAGNQYSEDERLIAAGVSVKIVNLPSTHIFHHKVVIVDGNAFSTGSFNYSQNANEGNAENLMIVSNRKMATQLEAAFNDYWSLE